MLSFNNSAGNEVDDKYYGIGNTDFDEDEDENENDQIVLGITETIHNINIQGDRDIEDIQYPTHPDIIENTIMNKMQTYRLAIGDINKQKKGISS